MASAADTMPFASLLIYSSITEIVTAISLFVVASVFDSLDKNKKTPQACPKLRKFQLCLSALIIVLSTVHAGLLAYPSAFSRNEADPVVASALFIILTWVILLLPLVDRKDDAAYPHYATWAVILAFEILNTVSILLPGFDASSTKFWIDGVVVIIRLVSVILLLAVSTATKYVYLRREEGTPDETRPLLDVEASTDTVAADRKKTDNEDDSEEDEEEEEESNDEEKEELAKLKNRSWTEYLGSFKVFLPHLRPSTKSQYLCLTVMIACTAVTRVLNVLTPLSLGWVVNSFEGATTMPWKSLAQYLVLYLINSSSGVSVISELASAKMSMSMRKALDVFVYNHVMNLDAKFHDSKKTATLSRITDRGENVIDLFQEFFFDFMPTIADLLISLVVLQTLFGAYLCFIVAITGVLFAWSNTQLIKNRTVLRRKFIDSWCAVYQHMYETQDNWTTVAQFCRVDHEKQNYRNKISSRITKELALMVYTQTTRCTRQIIMSTGFIFATILAANQIIQGHRRVGDFVMLVTYWSQVMSPVRSIISTITSVSEQLVDAERLMLVLETQPAIKDEPGAPEFVFKGGDVDFDNVNFSYDGERTVSEGISFHADAGQTIALVGETGGGKSTLLKLLFRFYDPVQGRILVDGQDLQKVKIDSYRNLVGIVPQDPAMFNRTILENVRYPDNTATEEEVIEACKAACLHDKIMTFGKQYKEKVGARGTKLSGGECQRLAIARAILKKPKMLLLDEATSAVDSVTESKIQASLRQLCKGRTTFVIAHRLSTILHADQIMVIKGGKLLEMGPHRELIKRKGAYRELWDAQLNLQQQDPGEMDDDNNEVSEDKKKGTKAKKNSMFYNDMGEAEISEDMLLDLNTVEEQKEMSKSTGNQEEDKDMNQSLNQDEVEVGSGDATEVESCGGDNTDTKDNSRSPTLT